MVAFTVSALGTVRGLCGVRRMEFQVFLLGTISASVLTLALIKTSVWLKEPVLLELMPLEAVALCVGTAWALTSIRVSDARHILVAVVERLILVGTVIFFIWSVQQLAQRFMHTGTAYVLSLSTGLWFAAGLHPWLRGVFYQQSRLIRLRRAAFEVTGKELQPEAMEDAFIAVLKEQTQAERVVILMSSQSRLLGGGLDFPADAPAIKALHALRWVTPERLERENNIAGRELVRAFLAEHALAVVVTNAEPVLSFAVALGLPQAQRPFTHHEITRLLDVAGMIENALSRVRYLQQAQHAAQLATVGMLGASIAHEIRNPLVSIKTFVQLLPNHYQEAVFRDKFFRLIGSEVNRIDRLTEQLLDLSAPRIYAAQNIEVHALLGSCIELVTAKAEDKGVKLITDFHAVSDMVQTDPNALKQVILNLSFNAIQALEQKTGDRWIRFKTFNNKEFVEVEVSDSGPGIAPEVWGRLFQPFHSTKSSGFGLGLAICKDILSSVHANIYADPPVPGSGATFHIVIPCPPLTS
jgi:signal transduction histidine kinase